MPINGQIIPEYLHPHVKTYLNDNTVFQESTAAAQDGVRFLNVIASEKGRDGVMVECSSVTEYMKEFGNPKYDLYGQPCLMPYASLQTGKAKCWVMRVMPEDAAYANALVLAKVKVVDSGTGEGVEIPAELPLREGENPRKLLIKHNVMYHSGLLNKDEFETLSEILANPTPDADGWMTFPLMGFTSKGRGKYGNNFRVRVAASLQADKDNAYKNHRVEVLEASNGLSREEIFQGTMYFDALDGTKSLFLEDLINDTEGSTKLETTVFSNYLNQIYEIYTTQVNDKSDITIGTFDVLTALDKSGRPLADIAIDVTAEDHTALDVAEGFLLFGGTEGKFDPSNGAAREQAINEAYIKAFEGHMDKAILSKRRTPADFILDANYAEEVKRALVGLITKRYDSNGFIDAGILETQTDAIEWAQANINLGDASFSKDCSSYKIRDPFTGKIIPVTITHFLATTLPVHVDQYGIQTPLVGSQFATVSSHIKNSVRPIIDVDDYDVKEKLYEARVNYCECIGENTFIRATQGTAQNTWSDLSEENNMRVVMEIKRKIENMVISLTYNFAEAEDRAEFTATAKRLFASYIGTKVRSLEVYFDMNQWEEERSILHCYLAVQFKSLSKRGIVEIDINKRV